MKYSEVELGARLDRLQEQNERLQVLFEQSRKRSRIASGLALCAALGAVVMFPTSRMAKADDGGGEGGEWTKRICALEKGLAAEITRAKSAEAALATAIGHISLTPGPKGPAGPAGPAGPQGPQGPQGPAGSGGGGGGSSPFTVVGNTVVLSGYNLQIINGLGDTSVTNGTGNLIIGYNDLRGVGDLRTGSHNLIVGDQQNYSGYGGIVSGFGNTISTSYASVLGGYSNTAAGFAATVTGGYTGTASGALSSISGGNNNNANGAYSSITGGSDNIANGDYSSISGGQSNTTSLAGLYASMLGGSTNAGNDQFATVSGGNANQANGKYASVSGGQDNSANGIGSSVTGGTFNIAGGANSSVGGGSTVIQATDLGWAAGSLGSTNYIMGNFSSP